MRKRVILTLMEGSFEQGFPAILRISENNALTETAIQIPGKLPPVPHILEKFIQWQLAYNHILVAVRATRVTAQEVRAISVPVQKVTNVSSAQLGTDLEDSLNEWLNSESISWKKIQNELRVNLETTDEIEILIETNNLELWQLPWHKWNLFEDYPKAEVALSKPEYKRSKKIEKNNTNKKVKILAIFGDSEGIDLSKDRADLEQLSKRADIELPEPLLEPKLKEFHEKLWEQNWDILFFAGHSSSHEKGRIMLNKTDEITIDELKYALKEAIDRGLRLTIFNSCDGLRLGQELLELHLPQVIVMRELVPDAVAQNFLKYFLAAFVSGQSLYTSVREARQRLQGLEKDYPYATWLPVICQNPAEIPPTWQDLCGASKAGETPTPQEVLPRADETPTLQEVLPRADEKSTLLEVDRPSFKKHIQTVLLASVAVTALVMGGRYLGMLQGWELQAYDQLMRSRPREEGLDRRLLIVAVTEEDFQLPEQNPRTGSISDLALNRLLEKLAQLKPRAIALDIYRDYPAKRGTVDPIQSTLAARMSREKNFFAICKVRDREMNHPGIAPPANIPLERFGFSDVLPDSDGILRRHLLAMEPESSSPCTAPYALSAQLAFHYLEKEGIAAKFNQRGDLEIGNVAFKRLRGRMGGYQTVDTWGYQILLNYRSYSSPEAFAPTVTLADVLHGKVNPDDVRDRIVLIGVTAQSAKDYSLTPFSKDKGFYQKMPGIVIHAQMVSQLLSAVKDGRSLLSVWPIWGEIVWIWGWSVVGGFLVWRRRSSQLYLLLLQASGLGILFVFCYILFLQAKWVPLVPSALALIFTSGIVAFYDYSESTFPARKLTHLIYDCEKAKT